MVKGLERFREHFRGCEDQYVIIGGTACTMAMTSVGASFRATKDIDMVLLIDALDDPFIERFWAFVEEAKYRFRSRTDDRPTRYRFHRPEEKSYPEMIELFASAPEMLERARPGSVVPVEADPPVSDLSAILLDDDYDSVVRSGVVVIDELPILRAEHLILLKAKAWLDLSARRADGERVDSGDVKKHRNDVFRLSAVAEPDYRPAVPASVRGHLQTFIDRMPEQRIDLKALGVLPTSVREVLGNLRRIYELPDPSDG